MYRPLIINEEESAALDLENRQNQTVALVPRPPKKVPVLLQTLSFGLNGLCFAAYIVANGKLISMLGNETSGASAVVTPYQSVILGAGVGFTLSTGLELGEHVAKGNYRVAGDVQKAGLVVSVIVGFFATAAMLAMKRFLPLFFKSETATTAADFFMGCSIGNIPMLILVTDGQIAFQEGQWFIPPLTGLLLLGSSIPAAYFFSARYGAFGIGLGGSIAQGFVCLAMRMWLLTEPYKKYGLHRLPDMQEFGKKIKKLLNMGWKLSGQRLTEWGNLLLISTFIGASSNDALKAAGPLFQYIRLVAAGLQGVAQATGMLVSKNKGSIVKAKEQHDYIEAKKLHKNNVQTIIYSNAAGVFLNGMFNILFYFLRKPLTGFFLADDATPKIKELSETLLWIGMLGLIPDALRIISAGALRGWKDLGYPTGVSIVTMIVIGVLAAWGLSKAFKGDSGEESEAALMFYLRNITTLAAALLIMVRCKGQLAKDFESLSVSGNRYALIPKVETIEIVSDESKSEEVQDFSSENIANRFTK